MNRFRLALGFLLCINSFLFAALPFDLAPWDEARFQNQWTYDQTVGDGHFQYRKDYLEFYFYNADRVDELFARHSLRQFNTQESIDENVRMFIKSDYSGLLTTFSYRVWKDGVIIYEPKKSELEEQVIIPLSPKGFSGANVGAPSVIAQIKGLEVGCVLEVYYQYSKIHFPYIHELSGKEPIKHSQLEVRYRSERDLIYATHPRVQVEDSMDFDIRIYNFITSGAFPGPTASGLPSNLGHNPYVQFDWRHLLDFQNGEVYDTWFDYIPDLFYRGEIKDYDDFECWDNLQFGYRIYLSTQTKLIFNYQDRQYLDYLTDNLSFSRVSEDRDVMRALEDVLEYVDSLAADTTNIVDQVKLLNAKVNQFVILELGHMDHVPIVFSHYSLLSNFYYRLFDKKSYPVMPMLLKVKRNGSFNPDFISSSQFDGMAMGFMDKQGKFHFTLLGPYLGNFYEVDHFPSEFSGGTAVAFDLERKKYHQMDLPTNPVSQDGFRKVLTYTVDLGTKAYDLREDYEFYGAFRNRMYHQYMTEPDSAIDATTTSLFVRSNNGVFNRRSFTNAKQGHLMADGELSLNLREAIVLRRLPFGAYFYAMHLPYQVDYQINLNANQDFELVWQRPDNVSGKGFAFIVDEKRHSGNEVSLFVRVIVSNHLMRGAEVKEYEEFVPTLLRGLKVKLIPKE